MAYACVCVHIVYRVDVYASTTFATNHYPRHCKEKDGIKLGFSHFKYKSGLRPILETEQRRQRNKAQTFQIFHTTTNAREHNTFHTNVCACVCVGVCGCRLIDTNSWIWVKHEQNTDDLC